jgi:hypothetical protein
MPISINLEQAISKIVELPDDEQDYIAEIILAELKSERRWTKAFANSQDILGQLGEEALNEFRSLKTIYNRGS